LRVFCDIIRFNEHCHSVWGKGLVLIITAKPSALVTKKSILITIAAILLIIAMFSFVADLNDLKSALFQMDFYVLPLILLMAPYSWMTRYFKWRLLLKHTDVVVPEPQGLLTYLSGFSLSITPGKLGELLKCYLLQRQFQISYTKTIPLVPIERIADGSAMTLLVLICYSAYSGYGKIPFAISTALLLAALVIIQIRPLCLRLLKQLSKIRFLQKYARDMIEIYENLRKVCKPGTFILLVALALVSWALEGMVLFFGMLSLGYPVTIMQAIFIVNFATLIGAISMLPGGLFTAEASIMGILVLSQIPDNIAVAATLISRICTLWFGVFIGVICYYFIRIRYLSKRADNNERV